MVTKKDEKMAKYFADTFKDVIQPSLDNLQDKVDTIAGNVEVLKEDVGALKEDVHKIERHLEKIDDRLDRQGKTQDDLQERAEVLEIHAPAVA